MQQGRAPISFPVSIMRLRPYFAQREQRADGFCADGNVMSCFSHGRYHAGGFLFQRLPFPDKSRAVQIAFGDERLPSDGERI